MPTSRVSDRITAPLIRAPPPRIRRLASPPDAHSPALWNRLTAEMPAAIAPRGISTSGRAAPAVPCSKVRRAVSAAARAASAPWQRRVASVASSFFDSFSSAPSSASWRAISPAGSSVKRRMNRPTSRSSALRQYCQ